MQKTLGKVKFDEILGRFITKPQGKPTLVPMSDKRPAMNTACLLYTYDAADHQ